MNTDALLESQPRPSPVTERLKDFCRELAQRTGSEVSLSLTLEPPAWDCVRNDFARPYKPKPAEFCMRGEGYVVWFKRADGAA